MTKSPLPNKNRRQFDRLPFESTVQLFSGNAAWDCHLLDISLKGASFSKPKDWNGSIHDIYRISMTQKNSPSISMSIEITHIHEESIGVMWNKIDLSSFSQLKRILELNNKVRNRINKEISNL